MSAGSSSTNFVTGGNVHQNAQTFNPDLFSNVGPVKGYPGPSNGILAAAGDFGGKMEMKGGRKASPGPDYHSFEDSSELRAGTYGKNYAPVKACNNNQCGGRKGKRSVRKGKRSVRKVKRSVRKGKRSVRKGKRSVRKGKRSVRHTAKKHLKRVRRKSLHMLKDVRDLFKMKGGSPSEVPSGSTSNGYHQYMSNQPHTNVYGMDGSLSPSENALANPMKIKVANACASSK